MRISVLSSGVFSSDLGLLGQMDVQCHTATPSLFGVAAYVPALESYIARYGIDLQLESRLVSIDGAAKVALFEQRRGDAVHRVEERFDMIHVVPPQVAPEFIASRLLRSEEHTSEIQSLMRNSYAVFCLKKKNSH